MEKLSNVIKGIESTKFDLTNGKVNQVQARVLKANILAGLKEVFSGLDLEVADVAKGFIVKVPNEDNGSLVLNIDSVIKPLTYDFHDESYAYELDQASKARAKAKVKKA
jgi:hypothetical protein